MAWEPQRAPLWYKPNSSSMNIQDARRDILRKSSYHSISEVAAQQRRRTNNCRHPKNAAPQDGLPKPTPKPPHTDVAKKKSEKMHIEEFHIKWYEKCEVYANELSDINSKPFWSTYKSFSKKLWSLLQRILRRDEKIPPHSTTIKAKRGEREKLEAKERPTQPTEERQATMTSSTNPGRKDALIREHSKKEHKYKEAQ